MPQWTLLAAADDPFQSVNDFFSSSTWDFIVRISVVFAIALWLACAYWVFKDARRRIDDTILITVATLTGLVFGPIGLVVYAIVRPPEYLDDIRERELEVRMMEQRLEDEQRCSFCKTPVRDDYLVCPTCGRRLRTVCRSCHRPVEPQWRLCPYCETEMHGVPVTEPAQR
ncbi:MAG TPA: zinc ribbon domain-containing protein [Thermoleophilia bacterium]|nr:zinc ribbon domain-containing protein [Thermoleophilia bacterium]HQG03544.1 zinc ribbon domain-containing protein [Thermoleophilia bacterium]HQG54681.1 zinc ribbon domain-containing protein [Thermoleophilia bacterium]HQJ98062.1 zinc ribbon domain-containing protein [Thermoleophilia bacterium]